MKNKIVRIIEKIKNMYRNYNRRNRSKEINYQKEMLFI